MERQKLTTLDLYQAAYLEYRGIPQNSQTKALA